MSPVERSIANALPALWNSSDFSSALKIGSDVYQIGCILYELLTGRAPLLDATASGDVPPLRDGAKLAAIVDRCLRRVPDERGAPFADGVRRRDDEAEALGAPALRADERVLRVPPALGVGERGDGDRARAAERDAA